jgi:hypothetical protein
MKGEPMRLKTEGKLSKRLVMGFAGLSTAAVVAAAGFAGAAPEGKPSKAECEAAGFRNYGQCVRVWAQNKSGYGGNNNNTTNVNSINTENRVNQRGNNNDSRITNNSSITNNNSTSN